MKLSSGADGELPRLTPTAATVWWATAGAAVTLALVVAFVLWPADGAPTPEVGTTTTNVATTSTTRASTTSSTRPATTSTVAAPPESAPAVDLEPARQTAAAFVVGWLRPGSVEERTAALAGVTSPYLLPMVAAIPAERLPVAELVGVGDAAFDGYTATVPAALTDASSVKVTLARTQGGWLVRDIEPV